MTDELAIKRVERETDNLKVAPLDLLKLMLHDIQTGAIKPDGLLLLYFERPKEGERSMGTYRANVTWEQEVAYLQMQITRVLRSQL
jgi:hypothetical protein